MLDERTVKDMREFPCVEVSFVMEGRKLDLQQVTEELKITPASTPNISGT